MTLKNLMLSVVVVLCSCANIKEKTVSLAKDSPSEVVNCYINAMAKGKPKMLKRILNENFQFRGAIERNRGNKEEVIHFLTQEAEGCTWDCDASFEIIEQTNSLCIARVDFRFNNGVRSDYLTLHQSNSEWQIYSSVSTL